MAASEDGSRVFIGGTFTEVNGVARQNLAALDAVTGALILDWQADTTGDVPIVRTLAVSGNRLYVGGKFKGIDGTAKQQLAAIDVTTGNPVTWVTWVNGGVNEVRVSDDGTTVWVGGEFTRIRGIDRLYLGAIDATTGVPTAFSPTGGGGRTITIELGPDESWVYASSDNNSVFAYRHALSNDPTWSMKMAGNVQAMAATATDLYLGGHFSQFVTEHIARPFLGSANPSTGSATTWDPKASGLKGGGWAFVVKGGYLHAGGQFTHFDGVPPRRGGRDVGATSTNSCPHERWRSSSCPAQARVSRSRGSLSIRPAVASTLSRNSAPCQHALDGGGRADAARRARRARRRAWALRRG